MWIARNHFPLVGIAVLTVCAGLLSVGAQTPAPRIAAGGVIGAGLSNPPVTQVSALGIVSIFGENFAPPGTARLVGGADLVDGKLPENLEGVCVEIANARAKIFHLFPGQINIQAPDLPTSGTAPVQVVLNCGGSSEIRSNIETVTLQPAAPEFFFFTLNANGRNPIAAIDAATGALIGPATLADRFPDPKPAFVPAKPRQIISLFATGLGRTDPGFPPGALPDRAAPTVERVVVTFDSVMGTMLPEVLYAGVAPGYAGVYQINVRVPDTAPDLDLFVKARVGSFSSPAGAYLTVKK